MQKKRVNKSLLILGCILGMRSASASLFLSKKQSTTVEKEAQNISPKKKEAKSPYDYIATSIAQESKKSTNNPKPSEPNDFGFGRAVKKTFFFSSIKSRMSVETSTLILTNNL